MTDQERFEKLHAGLVELQARIMLNYDFIKFIDTEVEKTTKYWIFTKYKTILNIYVDESLYITESLINDYTIESLMSENNLDYEMKIHYK